MNDPEEEFRPNRAEKALGAVGAFTVAPLLLPMLPLMALLQWAYASRQRSGARRVVGAFLTPIAGTLVLVAFLLVCVVAIPYGALYWTLRRLGIVRAPPHPEEEDETQDGGPGA